MFICILQTWSRERGKRSRDKMREEKELIGQIVLQRNLELTKEKVLREREI